MDIQAIVNSIYLTLYFRHKSVYVSIQSATIPYSFYNVDYFNNTLVYNVNGGSNIVITIPQSNYNTTSLRTYLLSIMNGFTITYQSLDNTIVSNLNRAELADVPSIGIASKLAESGTNALRKGAVKLDNKRDKLANQIENARNTAQIEKSNLRKRIEAKKENTQNKITNFV